MPEKRPLDLSKKAPIQGLFHFAFLIWVEINALLQDSVMEMVYIIGTLVRTRGQGA